MNDGPDHLDFGIFIFALLAVLIVVVVFYLKTLQTALTRVAPENRRMEPGMVWVMLIPCWNLIWQFVIAIRVPDSLRAEFQTRGRDDGSDYGKSIAITNAILGTIGGLISSGLEANPEAKGMGQCVSLGLGVAGLTLFILFWVKVATYSNLLALYDVQRKRAWEHFDEEDDDYGRAPPKDDGKSDLPPDGFKSGDPGHYS